MRIDEIENNEEENHLSDERQRLIELSALIEMESRGLKREKDSIESWLDSVGEYLEKEVSNYIDHEQFERDYGESFVELSDKYIRGFDKKLNNIDARLERIEELRGKI